MEHLNRIEIQGIIGSVYVKDFANAKVANLSVATECSHTSQDGSIVIDVTWHRVVAWEGDRIKNLDQLTKGSAVHVIGRLRTQKYIGMDGCERTAYEILASELEIIKSASL